MARGSVKDAARILGVAADQRVPVYGAIEKFGLHGLLQELRATKTPNEQRVERARKELKSHG